MASDNTFQKELRRELNKLLVRTIAIRLTSGLLSFLALGAWAFLALVLWTAVTSEPPLWQTLTVSRITLVVLALIFGFFVILVLLTSPTTIRQLSLTNCLENL